MGKRRPLQRRQIPFYAQQIDETLIDVRRDTRRRTRFAERLKDE